MAQRFQVGDRVEIAGTKHASAGVKGRVTKLTPEYPYPTPPNANAVYTIQPDNQSAPIEAKDGQLIGTQ